MTQLDPALFEQIVQEVVRRLLAQGVGVGTDPAPPVEKLNKLELEERLVTLATLRNRLDGVQQLAVSRRAVVTPAVLDDLKDRGITLIRK